MLPSLAPVREGGTYVFICGDMKGKVIPHSSVLFLCIEVFPLEKELLLFPEERGFLP